MKDDALESFAADIAPAGVVRAVVVGDDVRIDAAGGVGAQDRFEIGSVTKAVNALLLALLAEEGVLRLDEPATELLGPGWRLGDQVTLERLASHRAGLPRVPRRILRRARGHGDDPYVALTVEDLRASLPPWFPRGRWYRYSNFGAGILGHALAARTGTPWPELVADRVLAPLGMLDTTAGGAVAQPHDRKGRPTPAWTIGAMPAAGALRSTAADMARLLRAQLGVGDLPDALRAAIENTHRARARAGPGGKVALGWHIHDEIHWHNGGTGGSAAWVGFDRKRGRGLALLANASAYRRLDRAAPAMLREIPPS